MALWAVEADTCNGCGQPLSESTDPVNEFGYTAEPHRCHACSAMSKATRAWADGGGSMDGVTFYVSKDG